MKNRLADYVAEDLEPKAVVRMWHEIDDRLPVSAGQKPYGAAGTNRSKGRFYWAAAAALVAGVGLGWFAANRPDDGQPPATVAQVGDRNATPHGTEIATEKAELQAGDESRSVRLLDGSALNLAPKTQVTLAEATPKRTVLVLAEGSIDCEVTRNPARDFVVEAGAVKVRVVGTKFDVARSIEGEDQEVAVTVSHGVVEVTGPDGVAKRLSAGESWKVRWQETGAAEPTDNSNSAAQPEDAQRTAEAPSALFERARAARNAGEASEAANLYAAFLRKEPAGAHSGLAALELGRLRMDDLGNPSAAVGPLRQASQMLSGSLRDDALARLVQVYARLGRQGECRTAQKNYLAAYPAGVHQAQVRTLCKQ